jgi:predicted Co/Zn/Cd cation transporter (cation efflux family)
MIKLNEYLVTIEISVVIPATSAQQAFEKVQYEADQLHDIIAEIGEDVQVSINEPEEI